MAHEDEYIPPHDATTVIATAVYTRGLWTALFLCWTLLVRPFKGKAIEWGVDEQALRQHLRRAARLLVMITIMEALLFGLFVKSPNAGGYLFLLAVALQWSVLPWFAARQLLTQKSTPHPESAQRTLVAADDQSPIPDLGYLLREATFAVDVSNAQPAEEPAAISAALYEAIETKFRTLNIDGIFSHRVRVVPAEAAQPHRSTGGAHGDFDVSDRGGEESIVVFGQRPGCDGLAGVEFSARSLKTHLSLQVRMRWLPPLRRRFAKLAHLPFQKMWWRAGVVPVLLALLIALVQLGFRAGHGQPPHARKRALTIPIALASMGGPQAVQEPTDTAAITTTGTDETATSTEAPATETTSTEAPAAETPAAEPPSAETPGTTSESPVSTSAQVAETPATTAPAESQRSPFDEHSPRWAMLLRFLPESFDGLVWLVAVITFLPLAGFALLLLVRAAGFVKGWLYVVTGMMLDVTPARSFRLGAAELSLGNEGALRSGLAYLQLMERALIDSVIAQLQDRNVDTQSIREESRVLINEGVFMTGGSLQASNVVVGAFGKLAGRRRQKLARAGKISWGAVHSKKEAV